MKIVEQEYCYLYDTISVLPVIAGFTKPCLAGDPQSDIGKTLSSLPGRKKIAHLEQLHGADLHLIGAAGRFQGDGLFTDKKNLVLVVRTADCLPLLFISNSNDLVGVVHMGWKGAQAGILENITRTIGSHDLSDFTVIAGVGLRRCCYRVGAEFLRYRAFKESLAEKDGMIFFDPIDFVERAMLRSGVAKSRIIDTGMCSMCSQQTYHSHRRDTTSRRTLSFVVKV